MTSAEIRKAFLDFFEKREHTIVPSSSLLPTDSTVLFTTAGMQQFKEYYLGRESPYGRRIASCQKCFRTSDIEEVGDNRHLTFLEMLGNFSFGDYFKKEAIEWAHRFVTKEMNLEIEYVSVFAGDKDVPEDKESQKIWIDLGIAPSKIKKMGREDNFWGPTGKEGPCGPTTEIFVAGVEIWNLVFNEFFCAKTKTLTPLKQKGIDTGLGLERLAAAVQKKSTVFETDLFAPLIKKIEGNKKNSQDSKPSRIIADHIRGSVFLISEGVLPSNLGQGYILRRLLRRAIRFGTLLNLPENFLISLAQETIKIYRDNYPEVKSKESEILTVIQNEEEKFRKTLEKGIKVFQKVATKENISGDDLFRLYDTYGFPLELSEELAKEKNIKTDKEGFKKAFRKHQEISRAGAKKKFGGIGEETSQEAIKLHTATHLLHQSLRQILGDHVKQMGSDINSQRLRFDFSHSKKMTPEEIRGVENLVNQQIKKALAVKKEEVVYQKAIQEGALAFFKEKYPEKVTVYSMGSFSKEICAGPHVKNTSELGNFRILKEESSGAGTRRIRAILE